MGKYREGGAKNEILYLSTQFLDVYLIFVAINKRLQITSDTRKDSICKRMDDFPKFNTIYVTDIIRHI